MLAPNVVSLTSLIEWLRAQNPEERYRYSCIRTCVFAQYLEHHGYAHGNPARAIPFEQLHQKFGYVATPQGFALTSTWTFGQALERALKMQESPDVYQ